MRSYQAARRSFGILEFLAWCLILIGGFVALASVLTVFDASRNFGGSPSFMFYFSAAVPGCIAAFGGFLGLVLAQMGRAGVDSAEYGQQSLKIAREQLELSKQALRQGARAEPSYAALQAAKKDLQSDKPDGQAEPTVASYAATKPESSETPELAPPSDGSIEYKGKLILPENGFFVFGKVQFHSLEAAKSHIDQLGVNTKADLGGVTRS